MVKVIVLGSKGMVGSMLTKVLAKEYTLVSVCREELDILKDDWRSYISNIAEQNDILINCIGLIPQKIPSKNENKDIFDAINTTFSQDLAEYCKMNNIFLIHISTNCVFAKGNADESTVPDAYDVYGISKYKGEPINKALVIRCSVIGPEPYGPHCSLMDWVLTQEGEIKGFKNHLWNGVTTLELSYTILNILKRPLEYKLIHLYSKNIMNKYDLVNEICKIWNKDISVLEHYTEYPYDKTLTSLEYKPIKTIEEQLLELYKFTHNIAS